MHTNGQSVRLSVVIPAYNEAQRIGRTMRRALSHLSGQPYAWEIIVVDDGSSDGTARVVRAYAQGDPRVIVLGGQPNRGKGYAVKRGMLAARGEYRLFMDADGSVDVSEAERFMAVAGVSGADGRRAADVVIGSISHPSIKDPVIEHNGWHRRFFGSLSKLLIRAVAVPGIYDTQRGFKLFTARAAEEIFPRQRIERWGFDIELLVIARVRGFRIAELPVAWDNPAGSKVEARDYVRTMRELLAILSNRFQNAYA